MVGTIFDSLRFVTAGKAMIGLPFPSKPSAAPRIKSTCPPKPAKHTFDYYFDFCKLVKDLYT